MISVLGMFDPVLLGIMDNNHFILQEEPKSLPEDPFDEVFLRETGVIFYNCIHIPCAFYDCFI